MLDQPWTTKHLSCQTSNSPSNTDLTGWWTKENYYGITSLLSHHLRNRLDSDGQRKDLEIETDFVDNKPWDVLVFTDSDIPLITSEDKRHDVVNTFVFLHHLQVCSRVQRFGKDKNRPVTHFLSSFV